MTVIAADPQIKFWFHRKIQKTFHRSGTKHRTASRVGLCGASSSSRKKIDRTCLRWQFLSFVVTLKSPFVSKFSICAIVSKAVSSPWLVYCSRLLRFYFMLHFCCLRASREIFICSCAVFLAVHWKVFETLLLLTWFLDWKSTRLTLL